jgi:hypothetical protein
VFGTFGLAIAVFLFDFAMVIPSVSPIVFAVARLDVGQIRRTTGFYRADCACGFYRFS